MAKVVFVASVATPNVYPALKAALLAATTSGFEANFFFTHSMVGSVGRWNSQAREPESEEVLRAEHTAAGDAGALDCLFRKVVHRHPDRPVAVECVVLEGVGLVSSLGKIAFVESIDVDDERSARAQLLEVVLESRRVHRDQAVWSVSRSENIEVGDLDLEAGDAGQGARWSSDLRGERRKGRQVVSEQSAGVGETVAGYLHSVAGVTGEPNDNFFEDFSRRWLKGLLWPYLPPTLFTSFELCRCAATQPISGSRGLLERLRVAVRCIPMLSAPRAR